MAFAECENVTKSAKRLKITQPALSLQIKALEGKLGVALFRRSGCGIALTIAGQVFVEEAQEIRSRSREAVLKGRLAIDMTESAGFVSQVTTPSQQFRSAFPKVRLSLVEARSEELAHGLAEARIDIAFMRPPVPTDIGWSHLPVHRERLVAALAKNHHLVSRKQLSLDDR